MNRMIDVDTVTGRPATVYTPPEHRRTVPVLEVQHYVISRDSEGQPLVVDGQRIVATACQPGTPYAGIESYVPVDAQRCAVCADLVASGAVQ
jgi:hypothetical protein